MGQMKVAGLFCDHSLHSVWIIKEHVNLTRKTPGIALLWYQLEEVQ